MTAPITIYLQWEDEDTEYGCTWCVDQVNDADVEYIRIDIHEALQRENAELHAKLETGRLSFEALMADKDGR